MRIPRVPHRWNISARAAIGIQRSLSAELRVVRVDKPVRLVAGCDAAFSRSGDRCIAGVVVWDVTARCVVETSIATAPLRFPYVPGLLSFREAPALLKAIRRLVCEPDAFMFDGHGLAHPRRFGLACHVGVLIDRPSVGCAKSRLVGDYHEPDEQQGSQRLLRHRGETVGYVVRTRTRVKPVFVSVGHRITLPQAVRLVLRCAQGYRLPEPTRLADQLVSRARRDGV